MTTTYEADNGWVMLLIFGVILIVIAVFSVFMWYVKARVVAKGARDGGAGQKTVTVQSNTY